MKAEKFILAAALVVAGALPSLAASSGKAGSCEAKAQAISLGAAKTVTLVDEWDPETKEFYDSGVYYLAVTLSRGEAYTVWIDSETAKSVDLSAYPREATDDEAENDISAPMADFEPAEEYSLGTAAYLPSGAWDEDDPRSWRFFIKLEGDIGAKAKVTVERGIKPLEPEGMELNPLPFSVSPREATVTKALIDGSYYLTADLKAGSRYLFRTVGGTAARPLGLSLDTEGDYEAAADPKYAADDANTAVVVTPGADAAFTFCVFTTNDTDTASFGLAHQQVPHRAIGAHPFTPLEDGKAVLFRPGRLVADTDYYDPIADEHLFRIEMKAGERWVIDATGADREVRMTAYDAQGARIAENDNMGDEASSDVRVALKAEKNGFYYVSVHDPALSETNEVVCAETTICAARVSAADGVPDAWDAADDTAAGASALAPLPADAGTANVHGPHRLDKADWYDTFSIGGRKGITYVLDVEWAGEETRALSLLATVFTVASSGRETDVAKAVIAPGGDSLEYTPQKNETFYVRLQVAEGVGLDYPAFNVVATARSDAGALYSLTVKTKGADATWQLRGDSAKYASGTSVLVVGDQTVQFNSAGREFVTPKNVVVAAADVKDAQATVVGVYTDTFDPKDDTVAGATRINPSAKAAKAPRTLFADDKMDHFSFSARDGVYYNFDLADLVGDAVLTVFKKGDAAETPVAGPATRIAKLAPGKGDWIVRVSHADAASPADGKYALEHSSANVGAISFARTALSAKKSAGAVALTVNRSSAEGKVRVRYGTFAGTAQPGVDYVAQQGELVWENGDRKAKTITVKLIPEAFAAEALSRQFKVLLRAVEEDEVADDEYLAAFAAGKDEAVVTVTETKARAANPVRGATTKTEVVPLEVGNYQGVIAEDGSALTNGFPALASVTFSAKAGAKRALSARVTVAGRSYSFAADTWDADGTDEARAVATLTQVQRAGKAAYTNVLVVAVARGMTTNDWAFAEGDAEVSLTMNVPDTRGTGVQEEISYKGTLFRDNAKIQAYLDAVTNAVGYYTAALVPSGVLAADGIPAGNGYLTLTLDARGKARVAGMLADGATRPSYSSIVAVRDAGETLLVPVFVARAPYCFGGTLKLVRGEDGAYVVDSSEMLVWNNDNAALTYDGEEGWRMALEPVGGYFNTVDNLQAHYLTHAVSVSAAVEDIPEEVLAKDYSFVTGVTPDGKDVSLQGNALSTERKSLVRDGRVYDLAKSVNPCNVQVRLARATGLVTGSFSVWTENDKGAQKEISNIRHTGVLILARDVAASLDANVLSAGFFTQRMSLSETDANGRTKRRNYTASLPFNILAVDAGEPDWWADDWGERPEISDEN